MRWTLFLGAAALAVAMPVGCSKDGDPAATIDLEDDPGAVRSIVQEVLECATAAECMFLSGTQISLRNSGNCSLDFKIEQSTTAGGMWFSVTPTEGTVPSGSSVLLVMGFSPAGLPPAVYSGKVAIKGECRGPNNAVRVARGSPATVAVSLTVRPGTAEIETDRNYVPADRDSYPRLTLWRPTSPPNGVNTDVTGIAFAGGYVVIGGATGNLLARYDPYSDIWLPASSGPAGAYCRRRMVAVGNLIVCLQTLGNNLVAHVYDPASNTWSGGAERVLAPGVTLGPDSNTVSRGTHLLVLSYAVSYDPQSNSWGGFEPAPPGGLVALDGSSSVWTGEEVINWGGRVSAEPTDQGHAYNVATNTWRLIKRAPIRRALHGAVWAGSRMFVWGGRATADPSAPLANDGALYDPARDEWTPIAPFPASGGTFFEAQSYPTAVWTGAQVLVYGGFTADRTRSKRGFLFNPFAATSAAGFEEVPIALTLQDTIFALWAGSGFFVLEYYPGTLAWVLQ